MIVNDWNLVDTVPVVLLIGIFTWIFGMFVIEAIHNKINSR